MSDSNILAIVNGKQDIWQEYFLAQHRVSRHPYIRTKAVFPTPLTVYCKISTKTYESITKRTSCSASIDGLENV